MTDVISSFVVLYYYMAPPDYYQLLNIPKSATQDQIRQAYKKESLRTHPDRFINATPDERKRATEKFQAVADAYYVLSDDQRRREYDALRPQDRDFNQFFGGSSQQRPDADNVFTDVFDELLRPEVQRRVPIWSWIGAICAAGLGFIIANVPGALGGAVVGHYLGRIRDSKGKSVAAVFNDLNSTDRKSVV